MSSDYQITKSHLNKVEEVTNSVSPDRELSKEFQDTNYINNHLKWKYHVEDQVRRERALE